MSRRPLIVHLLYRLDTGGMERVAISVIQRTSDRYRHAVICLAGAGTWRHEIEGDVVACLSLHKKPGKDWPCYLRLWRQLRRLKPDLLQTYNIGTLDSVVVARLAGVRRIVHAEHGRHAADPFGRNRKYALLRRWLQPLVARYVPVSRDLETWLRRDVGIRQSKIVCIPNGIDIASYAPSMPSGAQRVLFGDFAPPGTFLMVAVGRLDPVKDHAGLVAAFATLQDALDERGRPLRLAIIGEGPERSRLERQITRLGLVDRVRLFGNRHDVATLLGACDLFALSSVAEGIPLTVLEAMAAGLAVVATRVGGVEEVVVDGETGTLVPASDTQALARALRHYAAQPEDRLRHGRNGRKRVTDGFSLTAMVRAYTGLYDRLLGIRRLPSPSASNAALAEHRER